MSYEDSIRKRRQENRNLLKSLGIFNSHQGLVTSASSVKHRFSENSIRKVYKAPRRSSLTPLTPSRKSNRLLGKEAPKYTEIEDIFPKSKKVYSEKTSTNSLREKIKRENVFGAIPDVPVGTEFVTRLDASHAGIHRPTVAGIHGNPVLGCYSISLSGGYEDDVDLGESFMYTGEGGRDLKGTKANPKNLRTAPQSKDQELKRGNLALTKNIENNVPVRVLRGYKLRSKFAPSEGYRYDGLYKVVEYHLVTGKSGFSVYKFQFERLEDQEPAPWFEYGKMNENLDNVISASEKENVLNNEMELNQIDYSRT